MSKSWTSCSRNVWTPQLKELYCTEGVAFITGGPFKSIEVYGHGLSLEVGQLPFTIFQHTSFYIDGYIVLCGGRHGQSLSCFKLKVSKKGKMKGI